jgi:alkanesulfonate monooxygenase SsuD/methylene tetrahydromethanopterin reductase-like flavin-dependent oxidoreductase (luciferase family)
VGNHVADRVARYDNPGDPVPRALTDYIKAREGYDYSHHGKADNPSTAFVPDDIVDRFCLLGPPERHVDRLTELREIGAGNFSVYLMHDSQDATLDAYAAHVIGAV